MEFFSWVLDVYDLGQYEFYITLVSKDYTFCSRFESRLQMNKFWQILESNKS